MDYKEFSQFKEVKDKDYPFCKAYTINGDEIFFVEPMFYTQLTNLLVLYQDRMNDIIDQIKKVVICNKKVVFCHDFENPMVKKDDFVYLEIEDILNPLQIFAEDKSRGSDYGD